MSPQNRVIPLSFFDGAAFISGKRIDFIFGSADTPAASPRTARLAALAYERCGDLEGDDFTVSSQKRVIALGFFDGVHKGHGALLRAVTEAADRLGAVPAAFTFDRSPTAVITGQMVPLLSTVEDRGWLMRQYYGIQEVIVAPFDGMQKMDWQDFIAQYLAKELGAIHVVAGHDFHFGYMGKGNPERLKAKCAELGIGCDIIGRVERDGITISSTYIRTLIAQGEMERATEFLGHPHTLTGRVTHGKHLGSSALGFPTVNLRIPSQVIIPAYGVYATRIWFDGQSRCAVTNVGIRPTVEDNDGRVTVEGFILDFHGDLYGHEIRMEFYKYLRPEQRFSSLRALSDAIRLNAEQTRAYFQLNP